MTLQEIAVALGLPKKFKSTFLRVAEVLIENADHLEMQELCLFGSVARMDFTMYSDLDFLVLTKSTERRRISVLVEGLDVRDDAGHPSVDVIVRNREDLRDKSQVFNREVLRDAIVLWRRKTDGV